MYQELIELYHKGVTRPVEARQRCLLNLKKTIIEMEGDILSALRFDLGKSEFEGRATETGFVVQEINHALQNICDWTRPQEQRVPLMAQPAAARVEATPKGAVLVIAPWNYPFHLALAPVVAAVAAGNTVAVKPSELAPNVSRVIA
jgi:aldehyde dehydrogenase (NAD+)